MNWLIFGGAGFIGTNLALSIKKNSNDHVAVFDDFSTVHNKSERIQDLKNIIVFNGDVSKANDFEQLKKLEIDVVVNLACPASPTEYKRMPDHVFRACSVGTKNTLDYAIQHKAYFLHASSSEIYGNIIECMEFEGISVNFTDSSRSIYTEGKRFSESIVNTFKKDHPAGIIRIFNTYGPYMDLNDGRVIAALFKSHLQGYKFPVEGGNQRRSFMYIDDLVRAIHFMVANQAIGTYNVGNPNANLSINELLAFFKKKIDKNIQSTYSSQRDHEILDRKPNIEKIRNTFGWEPLINIETGIKRTQEWLISLPSYLE